MTEPQKEELAAIASSLMSFFRSNSLTFKEHEAISNAWCVLYAFTQDGVPSVYANAKRLERLEDYTYSEEQLNWIVPKNFPRGDWDRLPWEQPISSKDDQRQRMISQNDANLTKAYMDTFSRPSIAKYL